LKQGVSTVAESLWIDVSMWSGLSGKPQPFTDVQCEPPADSPDDPAQWRDWALQHLNHVAEQNAWQPGRYHFNVEQRDPSGHALDTLARGVWEWRS
jgi:hypothetical protein